MRSPTTKSLALLLIPLILAACQGIPSPALSTLTIIYTANGVCDALVISSTEAALRGGLFYRHGTEDVRVGSFDMPSVSSPNKGTLDHDDTYYGLLAPVTGNTTAELQCFKNNVGKTVYTFDRALATSSRYTFTINGDQMSTTGLAVTFTKN
ncbi:hypothetical protein Q0M94_28020 (plasmid) [Deinococcus radiomollis]|uniref:hypothetical protein n=1 Tax=Deinococcus radiomollis TaxID=468916 RepID=UPI0038925B35